MNSDKLVYEISNEVEETSNIFSSKQWVSVIDQSSGNYSSNQSIIETSSLSNSNNYIGYGSAYLSVPVLLTICTTSLSTSVAFASATAATSADYAIGLKNNFGNLINSINVQYNSSSIVQSTNFSNVYHSWRLETTLSIDDINLNGPGLGFYLDDESTYSFEPVPNSTGCGVCNNSNYIDPVCTNVAGQFNSYNKSKGNIGFLKRQQYLNFDPQGQVNTSGGTTATYESLLSTNSCNTIWKSYISNKINGVNNTNQGVFQISIMANIMLRHIHSFFNLPLLKGAFLRITLSLNNCSVNFRTGTTTTSGIIVTGVNNAINGCVPLMLASCAPNNGGVCLNSKTDGVITTYVANLSIGSTVTDPQISNIGGVNNGVLSRQIYLYAPSYQMTPLFENAYISDSIKTHTFEDIYQYEILNIPPQGSINQLLSNSVSNIKSILLCPYYSTSVANSGFQNIPSYQSPFNPCLCSGVDPLIFLSNLNVVLSGVNVLQNSETHISQQYLNNQYSVNSVNQGVIDGISSGTGSFYRFQQTNGNLYLDLSRMLTIERETGKSVELRGINQSNKIINIMVFITFFNSLTIDTLTGIRLK